MHYANLSSNSIHNAIAFFRFLICVYFNEAFVKDLWKNYHFVIQISKIHFQM